MSFRCVKLKKRLLKGEGKVRRSSRSSGLWRGVEEEGGPNASSRVVKRRTGGQKKKKTERREGNFHQKLLTFVKKKRARCISENSRAGHLCREERGATMTDLNQCGEGGKKVERDQKNHGGVLKGETTGWTLVHRKEGCGHRVAKQRRY